MAAQHSLLPFVISFHAKSRKIWLKQTGSLHFLLNRKRLYAAPIVKIGRCHRGQGTLPVSILRPSCYLSKQRMLQSCATLVVKSRASVEREIPINFASLFSKQRGAKLRVKYWEIIADNLSKAGWVYGAGIDDSRQPAVGCSAWLDVSDVAGGNDIGGTGYFLAAAGEIGTAFCRAASNHLPSRLI